MSFQNLSSVSDRSSFVVLFSLAAGIEFVGDEDAAEARERWMSGARYARVLPLPVSAASTVSVSPRMAFAASS